MTTRPATGLGLALLLSLTIAEHALALETLYLKMNQPPGWQCNLDEGVWTCRAVSGGQDAVIFATMVQDDAPHLTGLTADFVDYRSLKELGGQPRRAEFRAAEREARRTSELELGGISWTRTEHAPDETHLLRTEALYRRVKAFGGNHAVVVWMTSAENAPRALLSKWEKARASIRLRPVVLDRAPTSKKMARTNGRKK